MPFFNFSVPSKQSLKGIVVLWGVSLFKLIKRMYLFFFFIIFQFVKEPEKAQGYLSYLLYGTVVLLVYLFVKKILDFHNFRFYIEDDNFVLKEGVLKKNTTILPFSKIQNVSISQNVLHQLMNVVQLSIDSAGTSNTEIEITALSREKAIALKQAINFGSVDSETRKEEAKQHIDVTPFKLLLVGLTQNHLRSLSFVFAALVGVFSDIEEIFELFGLKATFDDYTNLEQLGFSVIIVLALIAFLVAILYSVISIFVKNYNLKVLFAGQKIDIFKGLFNKIHYSLQINKVQSFHIETNFIKKRLNFSNVVVKQAMSNQLSKKNIQIVGVGKLEVQQLQDLIYKSYLATGLKQIKPNSYFLFRSVLFTVCFVFVLNSALYFLVKFKFIHINWVIIPVLLFLNFISYRKRWFSVSNNHILSEKGSISTITDIVETYKIQAVNISQTFGQKRKSIANINIFVASTKVTLPCIDYTKAMQLYNYLLFKVESTNKNWN